MALAMVTPIPHSGFQSYIYSPDIFNHLTRKQAKSYKF
jgi:hypothetical protein